MTSSSHQCAQAILGGMPPVMWFIRRHMRQHRAEGLSVPQFRILGLLDQQPRASQSCLCEHLGCTAPTVSRLVTGLIGKGLAQRKPSARDRRQVALVLTPRGRQVLAEARRSTRRQLAVHLEHFSAGNLETIDRAMRLLGQTFAAQGAAARGAGSRNGNSHPRRRPAAPKRRV